MKHTVRYEQNDYLVNEDLSFLDYQFQSMNNDL